jgi:hypothetical protein
MSPTGFIEACRLGYKKLFLGVLSKNKFFYSQITHNGEHIKNSKKKFLKILFFDGAV